MYSSHRTNVVTQNLLLVGSLAGPSDDTRVTVLSVRGSYRITTADIS
jgi:hypothetical protein